MWTPALRREVENMKKYVIKRIKINPCIVSIFAPILMFLLSLNLVGHINYKNPCDDFLSITSLLWLYTGWFVGLTAGIKGVKSATKKNGKLKVFLMCIGILGLVINSLWMLLIGGQLLNIFPIN